MKNRELKFRAWDKKRKKMFHFEIDDTIAIGYLEIMQFFNIKDKSGKEIYEGDLFKLGAEKQVFEVKFEHGCFMAFRNGKQFGLIGELQICFIDVIGNIYENPELLQDAV